jgi:N-acetylneuraminic acid mutarotase
MAHAAVWTGDEMILWGGSDTFDWLDDGAIYDPSQNSWGPDTSDQGQPFIRESMSHVWTDQEMLIWGGWDGGAYLQSGARYSPESDSWTDTNEADAPLGRANHVTLWTGKELFVWGGCGGMVCMNEYADGARYAPSSDSWLPVPTSGGLSARQQTAGVWIGNEVVIFGGRSGNTPLGDGARAAL